MRTRTILQLLTILTIILFTSILYSEPQNMGIGIKGPGKNHQGEKILRIRNARMTLRKVSSSWILYEPGSGVKGGNYHKYLLPRKDFLRVFKTMRNASGKTLIIKITRYRNIKGKPHYYCDIVQKSSSGKITHDVIDSGGSAFRYGKIYTVTVRGNRMFKRRFNFDTDWVYTPRSGVRSARYDHYYFIMSEWNSKVGANPKNFGKIILRVKLKNKWSKRRGAACKRCQAPHGGFLDNNYRFHILRVVKK